MGTVRFQVPDPLPPDRRAGADTAALAGGYELTVVPTRRQFAAGRLDLTREGSESGCVQAAWPAPGVSPGTLSLSATLRERAEPYRLPLELARGRLNRLRCQLSEWIPLGLTLEPADAAELSAVTRRFAAAVTDPTGTDAVAEEVLGRTHRLIDRVARTFAEQLLLTRLHSGPKLPLRLAARLSAAPPAADRAGLTAALNAVRLVPDWAAIEPTESKYDWSALDAAMDWAAGAGLSVTVGPMLDLAAGRFPGWLSAWAGDFPSLAAFTCDFVESVVRRYQGRAAGWLPVGGFNQQDALGLGEDDRIRLAARLLEAAGRTDPGGELILSVGQPWGDYLSEEAYTYSPLVFADTMVRAGFQFGGVELELLDGPPPLGSRPRDALEVFRLVELFGMLGVPLELTAGPATGWIESAVTLAVAVPHVRQVTWSAADPQSGPLAPGGLFRQVRPGTDR